MKKCILTTVALLCLAGLSWSADWQQAEDLYRQGHFASALAEYEKLLPSYPNDPNLYYNIGNCYFKMGSLGLATANYYHAFQLAPRDADLRHNLSLSLQNSGERLVPAGMPEVLHKLFFGLTGTELKGLLFGVFWIWTLLACVWLLKHRLGKMLCIASGILLLVGAWYAWRNQLNHAPLAVVAVPMAELRSGPGTNFPASANVSQGRLLLIQDSRDNWREVVVKSEGIKGWMEAGMLEKI